MRKCIAFISLLTLWHTAVNAHGYVDYPKARQQICMENGGYWWPADGSGIPNAACRAAYQKSGGYALTQHHEYSANVADFGNLAAVKAIVKDGSLCAGGDSRKAGMDLPSASWQSTVIDTRQSNELVLRFRATTPHNPSFWQIYLSDPSYNSATQPLRWQDLTLLHQQADIAVNNGFYEVRVPMPKHRSGNAVLYTRWQRQDVVGEGFYNCSDITLIGDDSSLSWTDKGVYITASQLGKVGETALLRVFNPQGQEQFKLELPITSANQANQAWAVELARQANLKASNMLQIGVLEQNNVVFKEPLGQNHLYVANPLWYANLDLKAASTQPSCGGIDPAKIFAYPNWPRKDEANRPSYATSGDYMSHNQSVWKANWWTQSVPGADSSWSLVCRLP